MIKAPNEAGQVVGLARGWTMFARAIMSETTYHVRDGEGEWVGDFGTSPEKAREACASVNGLRGLMPGMSPRERFRALERGSLMAALKTCRQSLLQIQAAGQSVLVVKNALLALDVLIGPDLPGDAPTGKEGG